MKFQQLVILLLFALLIFILANSNFIEKIEYKVYGSPKIRIESKVVFFGDSITAGLDTDSVVSGSVNFGKSGATTLYILDQLDLLRADSERIDQATLIVVAIGINDISRRDIETVISDYKRLATELPDTPIIFCAVLHINEKISSNAYGEIYGGTNLKVKSLNEVVQSIAALNNRWSFLDINPIMTDKNGSLLHHRGDGLHLNEKGYSIWIKALREMISSITN